MKIITLIFALIILLSQQARCNNVQVSNVRLTGQNTTDDFTMVEFDISWENSWRYANGPGNWDAAWIFVKFRVGNGSEWKHAWLNNTGHNTCGNTSMTNGYQNPQLPFSTSNPVLGVFLFRSVAGTGTFSCQDIQLRWNYGANSVPDNEQVDIKVFAIEMVYVPQGNFYVGSGGLESGAFYTYPNTLTPFLISGEGAITVGTQAGNLYYDNASGYAGDQLGPIPSGYPKGFAAFYVMKYEISQSGYVDFLNTLTRRQQSYRVRSNLSQPVTNKFVLCGFNNPVNRNGISCRTSIPPVPGPVDFFCDLNNNSIPNEAGDGQNIACNWMEYADMAAYFDWAAIRLMTEFEFEKCGRGPRPPIPGEFAWGDNIRNIHLGLLNSGTAAEIPSDTLANTTGSVSSGPMRTGAFARPYSNRTLSGAGYYGCLELSGNVWERGVTVGNFIGRIYSGNHGNGQLDLDGFWDVPGWPNASEIGVFYRGGSYPSSLHNQSRLSDREVATWGSAADAYDSGGRGVRTAP